MKRRLGMVIIVTVVLTVSRLGISAECRSWRPSMGRFIAS